MRVFTRTAVVVGILALSYSASAQTDAQVGTWKLNTAKSKYNGGTAPKSSTVVVEKADGGKALKLTANIVLADGAPRTITYTAGCDGKDVAVTGTPDYNTVSMTCSGNTIKGVRRRGGKRAQTFSVVVSADGKTRTSTSSGTDAMGKKVSSVQVFDKQ